MIYLYTGKTGSGKTYNMVSDIYPLWKKGIDIYSNTKLNFDIYSDHNILDNPKSFSRFEKLWFNIKLRILHKLGKDCKIPKRGKITYFDDITELIELRDGIILMDEAQNLLDSRNWENLPMEFSNKLRQHRKHKLDLYATTQNMGTIDINMRRLVQRWSHCKDVFALFWLRNPSLLTLHIRQFKDIDYLYNSVDDLQVPTLRTNFFSIHRFKRRLYDTLWDIGFNAYKILWIQHNKKKIALIIPKNWKLEKVRQQLLLQKFYLDQVKSNHSKQSLDISVNLEKQKEKEYEQRVNCVIVEYSDLDIDSLKDLKEELEKLRKEYMNMD